MRTGRTDHADGAHEVKLKSGLEIAVVQFEQSARMQPSHVGDEDIRPTKHRRGSFH